MSMDPNEGMPQYGTGMHYPHCILGRCTGCIPAYPFRSVWPECAPAISVHYPGCEH